MPRTILITGTSSGYGARTARLFVERGWNVVATMRRPNPELFAAANSDAAPVGDRLLVEALDVTDRASIERALQRAREAFGAIDVLVNNAGIGLASAVEATSDAVIREVFETNTFGVMAVCRAAIPLMRERGAGTIINVTSSTAIAPMPLVAVYAASKWATEGFTESLAYELAPFGITTRLVVPGYGPTTSFTANGSGRMEGLLPEAYAPFAQAFFAKMADYPTAYCSEAEVAEAVLQAATDAGPALRYLAGADTKLFAKLRWTAGEERYLEQMQTLFGS